MTWGQFLAWVLGHLDELPGILDAFRAFLDAANLRDKADALKHIIDVLVPILEDFPTALRQSGYEVEDLMGEAHAQAIDIGQLWQLYQLLKPLLPILLDLLKK